MGARRLGTRQETERPVQVRRQGATKLSGSSSQKGQLLGKPSWVAVPKGAGCPPFPPYPPPPPPGSLSKSADLSEPYLLLGKKPKWTWEGTVWRLIKEIWRARSSVPSQIQCESLCDCSQRPSARQLLWVRLQRTKGSQGGLHRQSPFIIIATTQSLFHTQRVKLRGFFLLQIHYR